MKNGKKEWSRVFRMIGYIYADGCFWSIIDIAARALIDLVMGLDFTTYKHDNVPLCLGD